MKEWLYSIGIGPIEIFCFGPQVITGAIMLMVHLIIENMRPAKNRRRIYCLDSESEIAGGQIVMYKGVEYVTGNRYHRTVELYKDGKLCHVVQVLKNFTFRKL